MQGQRRNKDEEMAGKLRDLQSIYAAVVLAGFGLGRPLDIAGQRIITRSTDDGIDRTRKRVGQQGKPLPQG